MIKLLLLVLIFTQIASKVLAKQDVGVNSSPNTTANYTYKEFSFPKRNDSLIRAWKLKQPMIHIKTNMTNSTL